jgi:hypothetical protein
MHPKSFEVANLSWNTRMSNIILKHYGTDLNDYNRTQYNSKIIKQFISSQLSKSANVDIAAENIPEAYWQEIPVRRLLWH